MHWRLWFSGDRRDPRSDAGLRYRISRWRHISCQLLQTNCASRANTMWKLPPGKVSTLLKSLDLVMLSIHNLKAHLFQELPWELQCCRTRPTTLEFPRQLLQEVRCRVMFSMMRSRDFKLAEQPHTMVLQHTPEMIHNLLIACDAVCIYHVRLNHNSARAGRAE